MYHILHGSLSSWLNDSVISAVGLTRLGFIEQKLYGRLVYAGFYQLFSFPNAGELLNALYWISVPLLAFVNGLLVLRFLIRKFETVQASFALPILAVFYAIVSVHFQIPIYLYYTAGLSLAGLMWMVSENYRPKYVALSLSLLLSAVGVYYHAAQPLSGQFRDIFGGKRTMLSLTDAPSSIPKASLRIEPEENKSYSEILGVIELETRVNEPIFAFPSNAELYFLSGRRNPFRFYNSALGIGGESALHAVKKTIIDDPPKLVIYRADDKYNTAYSHEILNLVKERYDFLKDISGFSVYRARQNERQRGHLRINGNATTQ
jgi:hypothetical protein